MTVSLITIISVGDAFLEVKGTRQDGRPIKLSDYRGHYVLMHFWSPVYDTSMKEDLEEIKAIHQEYGDRLVILGWSIEKTVDDMKRTVEGKGITWPAGFLGAFDKAPKEYFRSPSHIVLIGPDGKALAKNV